MQILVFAIIFQTFLSCITASLFAFDDERRAYNRGFLNKCIQDKDCKPTEYCDHVWPNPIGSCTAGTQLGEYCILDRRCASKVTYCLCQLSNS
jgi:hypothetical protein